MVRNTCTLCGIRQARALQMVSSVETLTIAGGGFKSPEAHFAEGTVE